MEFVNVCCKSAPPKASSPGGLSEESLQEVAVWGSTSGGFQS